MFISARKLQGRLRQMLWNDLCKVQIIQSNKIRILGGTNRAIALTHLAAHSLEIITGHFIKTNFKISLNLLLANYAYINTKLMASSSLKYMFIRYYIFHILN